MVRFSNGRAFAVDIASYSPVGFLGWTKYLVGRTNEWQQNFAELCASKNPKHLKSGLFVMISNGWASDTILNPDHLQTDLLLTIQNQDTSGFHIPNAKFYVVYILRCLPFNNAVNGKRILRCCAQRVDCILRRQRNFNFSKLGGDPKTGCIWKQAFK